MPPIPSVPDAQPDMPGLGCCLLMNWVSGISHQSPGPDNELHPLWRPMEASWLKLFFPFFLLGRRANQKEWEFSDFARSGWGLL